MNSHCKGCQYHWNAGHPKDHVLAKDHNDWCTKYGKTARTIIGHCKLHDGKHVAREVGADMYREMVEDRMARLARKKTNNA